MLESIGPIDFLTWRVELNCVTSVGRSKQGRWARHCECPIIRSRLSHGRHHHGAFVSLPLSRHGRRRRRRVFSFQ